MAIVATTDSIQRSKASSAYLIKNPREIKNSFTPTDASKAADILKIGAEKEITELKSFLKNYDMTSISTNELKRVGRKLYDSGVIDAEAFGMFIAGNLANDEKGQPTNTHIKFNAIALFNERLKDYDKFLVDHPKLATPDNLAWKRGMLVANQAVGALAYFANSTHSKLSIDEQI